MLQQAAQELVVYEHLNTDAWAAMSNIWTIPGEEAATLLAWSTDLTQYFVSGDSHLPLTKVEVRPLKITPDAVSAQVPLFETVL